LAVVVGELEELVVQIEAPDVGVTVGAVVMGALDDRVLLPQQVEGLVAGAQGGGEVGETVVVGPAAEFGSEVGDGVAAFLVQAFEHLGDARLAEQQVGPPWAPGGIVESGELEVRGVERVGGGVPREQVPVAPEHERRGREHGLEQQANRSSDVLR
jgi:hypothetical protein